MMAQGDPQAMGRAKGAFIGALVGSAIVGLAFIIPGIISQVIIEPSGGAALQVDTGDDCEPVAAQPAQVSEGCFDWYSYERGYSEHSKSEGFLSS